MPYSVHSKSSGLRRHILASTLVSLLIAGACSSGSGGDADGGGGSGAMSDAGTGAVGGGNFFDGTPGGCPAERTCGSLCCDPSEACIDEGSGEAECVPCGGDAARLCGDVCCAGSDICYLGECTTPGADCTEFACATKAVVSNCGDGELCDQDLGKCMPSRLRESCVFEPPPQVFDPVPRFTWGKRKARSCDAVGGCQAAEVCGANNMCTVTWPHVDIPADGAEAWDQVSSTPMVADVDGDCVPEVIFNSYRGALRDWSGPGVIRAIRGDDGSKVWTTDPSDENQRTNGTSNLALGDIDDDGLPEVVAQGNGKYLVAFDNDGSLLWNSNLVNGGTFFDDQESGSVAIANLDGEGAPEIVFGSAIFDAQGNQIWERQDLMGGGTLGFGLNTQGPISCIADLDGDGRPELIGGNTAYRFTGTVAAGTFAAESSPGTPGPYWDSQTAPDGKCGIADFDKDGKPEVVLVAAGFLYVLNGQTGEELAPRISLPGRVTGGFQGGGAPNIADFDGDGTPDIGTASATAYAVFQFNGTALSVLWEAPTQDGSSRVTGSSVFDFDGDGRAEVIYNDELYLRIYPGVEPDCRLMPPGPKCDGVMDDTEILFKDFNGSRTRTEYPVVADVDGDFKAELVFSTNNDAEAAVPDGLGGTKKLDQGIEVWEDRLDNWVGTRPIWNQHTYHVTNVDISGRIPVREEDNWLTFNHYRNNAQGSLDALCAPDLEPFDVMATGCSAAKITVRVANLGCLGAGAGINVSFYAERDGLLGTIQTTGAIAPGGSEILTFESGADVQAQMVWVVVDDDGATGGLVNECSEDNNESARILCPRIAAN